ncbi:MAG: hypothetical protein R3F43_05525 [bacterium]
MIIVGSLTAVSLDKLGRRDKLLGFLLVEGLLTNVGGLLTSSPPSPTSSSAPPRHQLRRLLRRGGPFTLIAFALTVWIGARQFQVRALATDAERAEAAARSPASTRTMASKPRLLHLLGRRHRALHRHHRRRLGAALGQRPGHGLRRLAFAALLLLRYKSEADQFYRAVDWDLLAFFAALFVVINVMEHAQVRGPYVPTALRRGSSLPRRRRRQRRSPRQLRRLQLRRHRQHPLAAMLARILESLGTPGDSGLWWSVIFGANLGGNLTPSAAPPPSWPSPSSTRTSCR